MQPVELSYLRSACGVNRMDGVSNESGYERFGMNVSCGCREEVWSGGRSETTDFEVVWPQGANGRE